MLVDRMESILELLDAPIVGAAEEVALEVVSSTANTSRLECFLTIEGGGEAIRMLRVVFFAVAGGVSMEEAWCEERRMLLGGGGVCAFL